MPSRSHSPSSPSSPRSCLASPSGSAAGSGLTLLCVAGFGLLFAKRSPKPATQSSVSPLPAAEPDGDAKQERGDDGDDGECERLGIEAEELHPAFRSEERRGGKRQPIAAA